MLIDTDDRYDNNIPSNQWS